MISKGSFMWLNLYRSDPKNAEITEKTPSKFLGLNEIHWIPKFICSTNALKLLKNWWEEQQRMVKGRILSVNNFSLKLNLFDSVKFTRRFHYNYSLHVQNLIGGDKVMLWPRFKARYSKEFWKHLRSLKYTLLKRWS